MKILIIMICMFNIAQAFAGFDRGNGGDAIVCPLENTAIMYDFHETTKIREWEILLGESNLPIMEKVEIALSRLDKNNPARAERLRKYSKSFFKEAEFKKGIQLNDIPDTGDGWIPKYCDLKQVAIQRYELLPNEKRYTIDQDIWEKFDNTNKAMLILHEVIYRDFMEDNEEGSATSRFARYLHGTIISNNFEKISGSLKDYHDFLRMLNYQSAESHITNGNRYSIRIQDYHHPIEYYNQNIVSYAPLKKDASISLSGVKLKMKIDSRNDYYNRGIINFNLDGNVTELGVDIGSTVGNSIKIGRFSTLSTSENYIQTVSIKLLKDGSIKEISTYQNEDFPENVLLKTFKEGNKLRCKSIANYGEKVSFSFLKNTFSEQNSRRIKCNLID